MSQETHVDVFNHVINSRALEHGYGATTESTTGHSAAVHSVTRCRQRNELIKLFAADLVVVTAREVTQS